LVRARVVGLGRLWRCRFEEGGARGEDELVSLCSQYTLKFLDL
jgi:hypothetical protein